MMENMKVFGKVSSGEETFLYTLKAGNIQLDVTDFGASWVNLIFNGTDVLLGYDSAQWYESSRDYLGAVVGRVANRVGGAAFALNGKTYRLENNDGTNSLHGGFHGYDKRLWEVAANDGRRITFRLKSPSGDQGYPGNLELSVTYEVMDHDEILTTYRARSDEDTPCNPSNHSFFNLNGSGGPDIENHILRIDADRYLPIDEKMLPTGEPVDVDGTPFDFRSGKKIGQDISAADAQLTLAGGYDHNYVLNGRGDKDAAVGTQASCPSLEIFSPLTGICMKMSTTMPGLQLYTGNMLDNQTGKNGEVYTRRSGLALETQFFPDSVHHADYPSVILSRGEEKEYWTRYALSDRKTRRDCLQ